MEKEFIPYEQALELKELGFDEPCLKESEHYKKCLEHDKPGGCQLPNIYCGYPDCTIDKTITPIGLPLYQQTFKWFREKHGLFATIDGLEERLYYKITQTNEYSKEYNIYEEAELACLKKLIEIVKTK